MELSLDLCLGYVPKAVSELLRDVSGVRGGLDKMLKLEDYVKRLEEEMRKIDAFKRELPLCMLLLNDAIERLKEEATNSQDGGAMEPLKGHSGDSEKDYGEKKSSAQLWGSPNSGGSGSVAELYLTSEEEKCGASAPLKATVSEEEKEVAGLCLATPMPELKPQQQALRKQRRCWSPELHRHFVDALHRLGGSKVATPKQIRELMKVDGLTNDEVKSHLQKYRLHIQKLPSSLTSVGNVTLMDKDECGEPNNSQSGSPQGPLCSGTSGKGISSNKDDKWECHSWNHEAGEVTV